MSDNLKLWNAVEKTDPTHVKPITGKQYTGNSPKPHYLIRKATETFGPCGIGWGFTVEDERIVKGAQIQADSFEQMHIAKVRVWYKWDGERGEVEHIGGTLFSGWRKSGQAFTDEDAPKKSVTDALVKALSMIGFAGDIFMGRYDDSKYVQELREEQNGNHRPAAPVDKLRNVITSGKQTTTYDLDAYRDEDSEGQRYWDGARVAMKKCHTKTELRKWFESSEQAREECLTQNGRRALIAEVTAYAKTLPETTMEAA